MNMLIKPRVFLKCALSIGKIKKIPIYANKRTIKELKKKYTFCFEEKQGYKPIMKANVFKKKFIIKKKNIYLPIKAINVKHGMITASGFIIDKLAYISDCNKISQRNLAMLKYLNYLIVDCLRIDKHPSHFNFQDSINLISILKPKKAILTNLNIDLDYFKLKKSLPENILPAYDGMNFSF